MSSVIWDVTRLRRAGLRLRSRELDAPMRGVLTVQDFGTEMSFKRVGRVATLTSSDPMPQARRSMLPALFDPVVLRITDGVVVLSGIELASVEGRTAEHQQVWRCCPVTMPVPQASTP